MNTTFADRDEAMEAWAQIRALRERVHKQTAHWRERAKAIAGVDPDELETFNLALDDLLNTFSDTFDGTEKIADREIDEDPWPKRDEEAWRWASQ